MKKMIAWILAALLLLGTLSGCGATAGPNDEMADPEIDSAAAENTGEEESPALIFERDVEIQAFAAAMACHTDDLRGGIDLGNADLLWSMAGWYAAWMVTANGYDLISAEQVRDFLRSVGGTDSTPMPSGWAEAGIVTMLTAPDGVEYYAFPRHKEAMDELLGVTIEVDVTADEDSLANAAVTEHFDNGTFVTRNYTLTFEKNPEENSAFDWQLMGVEAPGEGPAILGGVDFTWEELAAQNSLKEILSSCPAIHFYGEGQNAGTSGWIFPRDAGLASLFIWDDEIGGNYRGCDFEYRTWPDGEKRAMVGAIDEKYGSWEALETYILDSFTMLLSMSFEEEDGGLLWFECVGRGGLRERLAIDSETLRLRHQEVYFEAGQEPSVTIFAYDETGPAYEFFDSWAGPMRSVTLHWEDFRTGERVTRTEVQVLPADWEYLPYEARWNDFTIWMDEGYTVPYVYPGPGGDYSLYLTTAKG